ncbi:hypothetical protein KAT92_06260 [Candidatus Babeliales bacterium]|nr:hypothetical protein [Candidatus Babeliales bacterium]
MVKSKIIEVRDEGTHMVFLVTKFEPDDEQILALTGWELTDRLCVVTALGDEARSTMGTFRHPRYDVIERTSKLGFNHTTAGVVTAIASTPFEDIPDVVDARDYESWMG